MSSSSVITGNRCPSFLNDSDTSWYWPMQKSLHRREIKTGQSASYFYEQSADQCSRGTKALEFRLQPRRKLIKQRPRKADEEHVQQSDPRNRSEGIKTSRLRYAAKSVLSRPSTGEQVTAPLQSIQIFNLNSAPLCNIQFTQGCGDRLKGGDRGNLHPRLLRPCRIRPLTFLFRGLPADICRAVDSTQPKDLEEALDEAIR
ncbi:unnamed protein product [Trichogramma brassicae]|uniref:Uncharacterized protein n=1 Tax=Trichogramma brassicae TaxID=86971 RepID=A0A6H5J689_9HYME|nr:unnamed protein product [Trichogramma brassicae]